MGGYSFIRVGRLLTKHYVDHSRRYAMRYLLIAFIPSLFAMMSSDLDAASGMAAMMYIVGAFAIAPATMNEVRGSGTKILVNTLPVSTAERMTFIALNTSVIYSLLAAVCGVIGIAAVSVLPFVEGDLGGCLGELWHDYYGKWEFQVLIWIIASGGVVINALARKHLIYSYIIAFVIFVLLIWGLTEAAIGIDMRIEWRECYEWIAKALYCSIPVVLYAAAYFILRRRQIKW